MSTIKEVVVGTPLCEPWQMFCATKDEWEAIKSGVIFTEERNLARILVLCGIVKSVNEVRRNKPELLKTLDTPDFLEVKWGKSRVFIQVGT